MKLAECIRPDQKTRWDNFGRNDKAIPLRNALDNIIDADIRDGARRDIVIPDLRDCELHIMESGELTLCIGGFSARPEESQLVLRDHAFDQLCTKVKAPAAFLRSLPAENALADLRHCLREVQEPRCMLRCAEHEIRGVVGADFGRLDNKPVYEILLRTLDKLGLQCGATDVAVGNVSHLRLVTEQYPGPDGKPLRIGISVKNSEVGLSSVSVVPSIWRLVCTNGLELPEPADVRRSWRHVGNPERLAERFEERIPLALAKAAKTIGALPKLLETKLDLAELDHALTVVELTRDQRKLATVEAFSTAGHGVDDCAVALKSMATSSLAERLSAVQCTAWDAINGITSAAQSFPTQPRLHMEEAAGQLLTRWAA